MDAHIADTLREGIGAGPFTRVLIHPGPGDKCDGCGRRVPHERKPSSPASKVKSLRIPTDEAEVFTDTLEAAAEHVGTAGQAFSDYKTLTLALALLLQDETVKGFATRKDMERTPGMYDDVPPDDVEGEDVPAS